MPALESTQELALVGQDSFPRDASGIAVPADLVGRLHSSADPYLREQTVGEVKKLSDEDRVRQFVTSLAGNPEDLAAVRHMMATGEFEEYGSRLLAEEKRIPASVLSRTRALIGDLLAQMPSRPQSNASDSLTWPKTSFPLGIPQVDQQTAQISMAIIGDGPAAVLSARLRSEMGYQHTTVIGRTKRELPKRGIWNHDRVALRGHNTFATVRVFGAELSSTGDRTGGEIRDFLDNIGSDLGRSRYREGLVTGVRFDRLSHQYLVTVQKDGASAELPYDTVCIATGNAQPKDIDAPDAPMTTNARAVGATMKRWQEPLPEKVRESFRGKSPVVVGLGNSAMEMIAEFLEMQEQGIPVHPRILTHLGRRALAEPDRVVLGTAGTLEGPVFRHPSNLTKVAGDIPKIRDRYEAARLRGWIVPDVRHWEVHYRDPEKREGIYLLVETQSPDGGVEHLRIDDVPMIYALIGYQNDAEKLQSWGCKLDENGAVQYHPVTHRVETTFGDEGGMYILGAAASRPDNRNPEVIPGMIRDMSQLAFAEIVRANRRAAAGDITPERIPLDGSLPRRVQAELTDLLQQGKEQGYEGAEYDLPSASILRHVRRTQQTVRTLLSHGAGKPDSPTGNIRWLIRRDMPEVLTNERRGYDDPLEEPEMLALLRQRHIIGMVHERDATDTDVGRAAYFKWLARGGDAEQDDPAARRADWLAADSETPDEIITGHMIYELKDQRLNVIDFDAESPAVAETLTLKLLSKLSPQRRTHITEEIEQYHSPRYNRLLISITDLLKVIDDAGRAQSMLEIEAAMHDLPSSQLRTEVGAWLRAAEAGDTKQSMQLFQTVLASFLSAVKGSTENLEHEGNAGRVHGEQEIVTIPDGSQVLARVGQQDAGSLAYNVGNGGFVIERIHLAEQFRSQGVVTEMAAATLRALRVRQPAA